MSFNCLLWEWHVLNLSITVTWAPSCAWLHAENGLLEMALCLLRFSPMFLSNISCFIELSLVAFFFKFYSTSHLKTPLTLFLLSLHGTYCLYKIIYRSFRVFWSCYLTHLIPNTGRSMWESGCLWVLLGIFPKLEKYPRHIVDSQ